MDMGMKYIYMPSHMQLHDRGNADQVEHFKKNFGWPSGMHINQPGCTFTGK